MPKIVKHAGAWKPQIGKWVYLGGTWKEALAEYRNQGGTWVLAYAKAGTPPTDPGGGFVQFTITGFSPTSGGSSSRLNTGQLSIAPAVQLSGGTGSFTYSWSVLSDDSGGTLSNASAATCSFSTGTHSVPDERSTTLRCTVTDTGDGGRQQTADFVRSWFWGAV